MLKKVADAAVLVFDGDAAGQKAAISTAGEMLSVGMTVRVAKLPHGEDPDSLLRAMGADAFSACLDNAVSIVAFQVDVARAKEANPDSYDAISRTGRAVLDLVKKCPGAVMRAGLMQEAATLLKIPVSALEEDLSRLETEKPKPVMRQEVQKPRQVRPAPVVQDAHEEVFEDYVPVFPEEEEVPFVAPQSEQASAPENNPPPSSEMALMEFLFGLGVEPQIADMLEVYAPKELFAHNVTGCFVKAYIRETRGETDAIVNLKNELQPNESWVLEEVFLSQNRAAFSELEPADNLRKGLCRFWFDAVCRKLKELPSEGDVELMRKRSRLSMLSRKFKTMPWHVASQSMLAEFI
jgi:DNA primase